MLVSNLIQDNTSVMVQMLRSPCGLYSLHGDRIYHYLFLITAFMRWL